MANDNPSTGRILVVEDEESVRLLLVRLFTMQGYEVLEAADGQAGLEMMATANPDIVLLDLMLPQHDGLEMLEQIRRSSQVPVILLTGKGNESDRVVGLRMGADDYIVKPFSSAELLLRIESVLRRVRAPSVAPASADPLSFDGLSIDVTSREVKLNGELVPTTAREFDLLAFLAESPRQVFSRPQLLKQVWDSSSEWQDAATVTEHVRRLRRKIEVDPNRPRRITTVRGVGYRFEP